MASNDERPPRTRKELYERIARGGRDQVILEEMIRLGFWSEQQPGGHDAALVARESELRNRLASLREQAGKLVNLAKLAEEAKQQRMAESRKRRLETKQRQLGERAAKRAATKERKTREIVHLGPAVSAGLGPLPDRLQSDAEALARNDLPALADAGALAAALGISLGQLRFLAFDREVSTVTQYRRFRIPKRTGGERLISAPRQRLKTAQRWILDHLLGALPLSAHAHGFRQGRSIVSNASPHVGAQVVVNIDLRDFFPSVSYRRVKGLFRKLGYAEEVATLLGLLCTEPDTVQTQLDGVTYYVAQGTRHLPQGAPTSPAITNLLCRRLDQRLAGFANKHGLIYTRYADDLTLSAPPASQPQIGAMLAVLAKVAREEGFAVHPDKVSVKRQGRRQEVTGLVVNQRLGVDRDTLRRFRALLHKVAKDGPEGAQWGPSSDLMASLRGFANYVYMVDPEKGRKLRERVQGLASPTRRT
jgi:retron-type reverse transcriptase